MDLDQYINRLREELVTVAEVGGEEATSLARRLATPLESSLRIALLDALADAAGQISTELAPGSVELVLRNGKPEFAVDIADTGPPAPPPPPTSPTSADVGADDDDGELARISLRLSGSLKRRLESAADRDGISANTWITRAIASTLDRPNQEFRTDRRHGNRVTGWAQ